MRARAAMVHIGMRFHRLVAVALLVACRSGSDDAPTIALEATHARVVPERIPLPDGEARIKGAVDDRGVHLAPDEGVLTIDPVHGKAGVEMSAVVRVTPGPGYHVSTDIPTSLTLTPHDGITLSKTRYEAGRGHKGDAAELTERELSMVIRATAARAGTYEIDGTFAFGVCKEDSCHAKHQPIKIVVTAT